MQKLSTYITFITTTLIIFLADTVYAAESTFRLLGYDFQKSSKDLGFLDIIYFILYLGQNLIGIAGLIAIIYMMIGGFNIVMSAGNQDQVQKGKNTLTYAIIGFVVVITAYLIVSTFLDFFTGKPIESLPTSPEPLKTSMLF